MIKLDFDGPYKFKIDGASYGKDAVDFVMDTTAETVTMRRGDAVLYEAIPYGSIADDDDNPFGSLVELQKWVDANARMLMPNATGRKVISNGSINAIVLKKAPGILYALTAVNETAGTIYLKVYDMNEPPDSDSIPMLTLPLLPSTVYDTNMFPTPVQFYNGIAITMVENVNEGGTPGEPAADDVIANLIWR